MTQQSSVRHLTCLDHLAESRLSAEAEFWQTDNVLNRRISSLGQVFTYGFYNNDAKVLGETYEVAYLIWRTAQDDRVCPKCVENSQKGDNGRFRVGWFLPMGPPVHPRCRCVWELEVKQEPKNPVE